MISKKNIFIILTLTLFILTALSFRSTKTKSILIENRSEFNYVDKVISIPFEKLKNNFKIVKSGNFKIINSKTKIEIPYQIEYLGTKTPTNLLLQISLKSKERLELVFLNENHGIFTVKTFSRYVPERAEDFAWENDKIAFRTYGKALELIPNQNAYGIDVWVKRTDRMILNERYQRGQYHKDHGDGMDYYHVGFTLGAGNCAPYINDSIWYSKNYTKWEILDNGPLRTSFKLYFDAWDVDNQLVTATKTISLDAGSQLNKIEVTYNAEAPKSMPIVIGIIKRDAISPVFFDADNGVLGYWEPTDEKYGTTGVGVIIPFKVNDIKQRNDQYLAVSEVAINKSFTYYSGAAWDKAGDFTNAKNWFEYLQVFRKQLINDGLKITY